MRAGGGPPSTTLVMRGGALGDFLLTLPVLARLTGRDRVPPRLAAAPSHLELARTSGLATPAFRIDDPRIAPLWAGGDLSGARALLAGIREVLVIRPVGGEAVTRRLAALGVAHVYLLDPRPPEDGSVHAADHLAGILGDVGEPSVPRLDLPADLRAWGERTLASSLGGGAGPRALLVPGAGSELKRWPEDRFRELAGRLRGAGMGVAWSLGPVERDRDSLGGTFRPQVLDDGPVQAASLLAAADVVVGNDTGTSHLAAALGVPVVALFGPTDHRTWGPRGEGVRVLRAGDYGPRCAGCPRPCPERHPAPCMEAIPVSRVEAAVLAAARSAGENARQTRPPGGPRTPGDRGEGG